MYSNQQRATTVIKSIADYLTDNGFSFDIKEGNCIYLTLLGQDFPVSLVFRADEALQRLEVFSQMPYEIKREKAVDVAMAISNINSRLAAGKFCVYIERALISYEDGLFFTNLDNFNQAFAAAVVSTGFSVVERYNDSLYALNKGLISLKEVLGR